MNLLEEKIKNIKKEQLIIFGVGLIIGLLTMIIFYPERIALLKNGEEIAIKVGKTDITADNMYTSLKDKYSLYVILEKIDSTILNNKYEMSEEDNKKVDSYVEQYLNLAKEQQGLNEEQFLEKNNFSSREEFRSQLELDYKRNMYYNEYMLGNITDEEVDNYYKDNVFGTINTEHILVKNEHSNAEEKAKEILEKLKNGTSFEDLKNEYKSDIVTEEVPISFDSNLESNYVDEAKKLTDGAYTKNLVKTSYGYHIIMRVDTNEKEKQEDITDRIKNMIISDKQLKDSNLYEKVMIEMRKKEGTEIKDTELLRVYENYTKKYSE